MMKKSFFVRFVVSALLVIVTIASTFGAGKKKKETPTHHDTVISSVTGNAVTVTDEKTTRTFTITQFTEINVNGQKATIADLKPGMTVSITIGIDPSRASRVNASGVPADHDQKRK
jgi:predicted double-glycine peptidase